MLNHLSAFSIDVEDLFYSIPQGELMVAVRDAIEESGPVAFQNKVGITVGNFLELLSFYLSATLVPFNNESFIQKQGVSIGSSIALVLSNLLLAKCDRSIETRIDTAKIAMIFRYVDDYMVVTRSVKPEEVNLSVKTVKKTFLECPDGLIFPHELPN